MQPPSPPAASPKAATATDRSAEERISTTLPSAPAQLSYSPGDSLLDHLDEDILDVIAEWQDS